MSGTKKPGSSDSSKEKSEQRKKLEQTVQTAHKLIGIALKEVCNHYGVKLEMRTGKKHIPKTDGTHYLRQIMVKITNFLDAEKNSETINDQEKREKALLEPFYGAVHGVLKRHTDSCGGDPQKKPLVILWYSIGLHMEQLQPDPAAKEKVMVFSYFLLNEPPPLKPRSDTIADKSSVKG